MIIKMMARNILFLILSLNAMTTYALESGQWVEVAGGMWSPDSTTISSVQDQVHKHFANYLHGKLDWFKWERYAFQYQGITTEDGKKLIRINAFCTDLVDSFQMKFDYSHNWLVVFGGGPCFFKGDLDVEKSSFESFKVNAPK